MRVKAPPSGSWSPRPARISFPSVKLPLSSSSSCSNILELEQNGRRAPPMNCGNLVRCHPFEEAVLNVAAFLQFAWAKWESKAKRVKTFARMVLADRASVWDRAMSAAVCSVSLARAAEIDGNSQQGRDSIANRRPDKISADRIPGGERDRMRSNGAQGWRSRGREGSY